MSVATITSPYNGSAIKCGQTHSYLPSFCISKSWFSTDYVMAILSALIQKIRFKFEERRRHAYAFLRLFRASENIWLMFLRVRGFSAFPDTKWDRSVEVLSAGMKTAQLR